MNLPTDQLDIGIGGLWVRLHADSSSYFDERLAARFAGFTGQAPHVDYEFELELGPLDPETAHADVRVTRTLDGWRVSRGDFAAEWDSGTRRGHVRMIPSPHALDSMLRILHTLVLAEQGGMLMHASTVLLHGRAWVFSGVSGVGKTTISRLAPSDGHILTDEMSCIRREGDGYVACGTPFSGELGRPGENLTAPLAGIFLLVQGPENRIESLSQSDAVRGLMSNILYFARDPALTTKVFDNAIDLAQRVPVRRLTFLPDQRVWDLIGKQP